MTRIERMQALEVGSYWRQREGAPKKNSAGPLVVLSKVRTVDDAVHSVQVIAHPSLWGSPESETYYSLLVDAFLAAYEPEPRGDQLRAGELAEANARIRAEQRRLEDLRAHSPLGTPKALTHDAAESGGAGTLPVLVQRAGALESHARALTAQADAVQQALGPMRALFHEQALIAKIKSSVVSAELGAIQDALKTFGLYTGEGVDIVSLVEGDPADPAEPLYLFQRLLYMDEESLLHVAYGGADFANLEDFGRQLRDDPDVLQRVAPQPRCVVAMQFRRNPRDYGNPVDNVLRNVENRKAFLLIRNGAQVHAVFSSMQYMHRLFPTADEFDKPFRGYDGKQITPESLRFPDATDEAQRLSLYYKRVLILLWGLYDRTDVLGSFALERKRGHLNLLSLDVQRACFRFVADDDRVLADARPSFRDWVRSHNGRVQSGSRVLCRWRELMDESTAPGCFSRHHNHKRQRCFSPDNRVSIHVVYRRGQELFVRVPVQGWAPWGREARRFNARVRIEPGAVSHLPYLCLDAVDPADIAHYLSNRETRREYLEFAEGLVQAQRLIEQEQAAQAPFVAELADALVAGGVVPDPAQAQHQCREAIRQWRAQHRGREIPAPQDAAYGRVKERLLHWLWVLNGHGRDRSAQARQLLERDGHTLRELRLTAPGRLVALASPAADEPDPRLGDHLFVERLDLEEQKTQLKIRRRAWLLPATAPADETRIGTARAKRFGPGQLFLSAGQTGALLATVRDAMDRVDDAVRLGTAGALRGIPIPIAMSLEHQYGRVELVFGIVRPDGKDDGLEIESADWQRALTGRPFPRRGSNMVYWRGLDSLAGTLDRLRDGYEDRVGWDSELRTFDVAWTVHRDWARTVDRAIATALKAPS